MKGQTRRQKNRKMQGRMMVQRNKKMNSFKVLRVKMKSWKNAASLTEGFLGAHRYTTGGGMCVLRRSLHGAFAPVVTTDRVLRNDRKRGS